MIIRETVFQPPRPPGAILLVHLDVSGEDCLSRGFIKSGGLNLLEVDLDQQLFKPSRSDPRGDLVAEVVPVPVTSADNVPRGLTFAS